MYEMNDHRVPLPVTRVTHSSANRDASPGETLSGQAVSYFGTLFQRIFIVNEYLITRLHAACISKLLDYVCIKNTHLFFSNFYALNTTGSEYKKLLY